MRNCVTLYYLDIDECKGNPGRCTENTRICMNTVGSFECVCKAGFTEENGNCTSKSVDTFRNYVKLI